MSRYEAASSKAGTNTANTILWAIRAGANRKVFLFELGLSVEVAPTTGPTFRLLRAATVGTASASVAFQEAEPTSSADAATAVLETTWSAAPTLAAVDLRRLAAAAAIGPGPLWTWDRGLLIPPGASLLIVNANATGATTGTLGIYAHIEE